MPDWPATCANLLERMWQACFIPQWNTMKYTERNVTSGGQNPAPDLNMIIAPAYAWLYHQTGNTLWRTRADLLFHGLLDGPAVVGGNYFALRKQYNQAFWGFSRYIRWRRGPGAANGPYV